MFFGKVVVFSLHKSQYFLFYSILFIYLFIYLFVYLFIYLWLCWVFITGRGLSLLVVSRGYSFHCGVRASHCGGFSCCGAQALGARTSVVVARGLSSCGLWA